MKPIQIITLFLSIIFSFSSISFAMDKSDPSSSSSLKEQVASLQKDIVRINTLIAELTSRQQEKTLSQNQIAGNSLPHKMAKPEEWDYFRSEDYETH